MLLLPGPCHVVQENRHVKMNTNPPGGYTEKMGTSKKTEGWKKRKEGRGKRLSTMGKPDILKEASPVDETQVCRRGRENPGDYKVSPAAPLRV